MGEGIIFPPKNFEVVMPAIRKLLKETKTFLEMLERNGGTLGGYYMQAQYIQLQIAIKNTEKELADE